jgi:streptogramin lyase
MACGLAGVFLVPASTGAFERITEFTIPAENSNPVGITAGRDGNLWFCERGGNRIGRITPQGSIAEFPTKVSPYYIATGPDGYFWFTEFNFDLGGSNIGRISPSGELKEFPLPGGFGACGIAAGSDGNLWFTTCTTATHQIGRITTGGTISMFSIKGQDLYPADLIAAGPDGNLWFTEYLAGRIGRITTAGLVTEFQLPSSTGVLSSIVAGPGGDLWFAAGNIGRITTGGDITQFAVAASILALGPDGNLWFANNGSSNRIGRLSITAGGVEIDTELPVPTADARVNGMTSGPDGHLWFTERNGNKIGRVDFSDVCPANVLCLGDRFQITAAWEGGGSSGNGAALSLTTNAGCFSFFGSSNIEVFVKVLDACTASGKFNVYVNGLTHLGVTVTVTDTRTGTSKQYVNPAGAPFSLIFDGSTFSCPGPQ